MIDPIGTAAPNSNANPAKLQKAAHDFEALMIGELLKNMDQSEDTMTQMAQESLAQSMANKGAFGIAKMIQKHLAHQAK